MTREIFSARVRFAVLALSFVVAAAGPAFAQEQKGFAKSGGYAGVSFVPDFTLDGETFDGQTYYQEIGGPEILILPKIDKQHMIRAILGYRGRMAAVEFSYERTKHDGTFGEGTGEAVFQAVNMDGRFFFVTQSRVQPYVLVGAGLPFLTVKDGSFLEDDPDAGLDDGTWKGWALNTEVGVTIYPHRQFGIAVAYGWKGYWFDRASGITDKLYHLRPRFREQSKGLVVTGLVTF